MKIQEERVSFPFWKEWEMWEMEALMGASTLRMWFERSSLQSFRIYWRVSRPRASIMRTAKVIC